MVVLKGGACFSPLSNFKKRFNLLHVCELAVQPVVTGMPSTSFRPENEINEDFETNSFVVVTAF